MASAKALKERHAAGLRMPHQAEIRLGSAATRILSGQEDLSTWDDEELLRGRKRDKRGGWVGKPAQIVPIEVHKELTRRKIKAAEEMFRDSLVDAVGVLRDIINGQDVEDKDRLKAAQMIIDRVMGKAPERVEITATDNRMKTAFDAMLVPDDEDEDDDIVDAEVVEEEDE